jgi:hypothetical protein
MFKNQLKNENHVILTVQKYYLLGKLTYVDLVLRA